MPGGRRFQRTLRASPVVSVPTGDITSNRYAPLGATVPMLPGLEQPNAPKHFPFPNTPQDNDLTFEIIMFFFTIIAAGLQFLHLYRTVWWLPHSYTSKAMNFYLIDKNLVVFILIILSRRLVYILGGKLIDRFCPETYLEIAPMFHKYFLFGLMFSLLSWCAIFVLLNHHYVNIFFLCYPICVYLILFGFNITPFFEMITSDSTPLHACTSKASEVRQEVERLKTDFNMRMKQILFSSVLNAYYAGFIPCCFAQNFLYYDVYWATQHVVFVFLACFTAYTLHILNLRYCDILHRSALHLGSWDRVETRSLLPVSYTWQRDILWPGGSLVRHNRDMYKALNESNAAEPGVTMHSRFYAFFKNPSTPLGVLLVLHVTLIFIQLALLVRRTFWYHIVSLTFLLFHNYYTLFKLARDYLVSLKIYRTEQNMHNKGTLY